MMNLKSMGGWIISVSWYKNSNSSDILVNKNSRDTATVTKLIPSLCTISYKTMIHDIDLVVTQHPPPSVTAVY